MSNGTSSPLNSEPDLPSIPMAQGGLSRLAVARLKSAGLPVAPLLRRAGLTPELITESARRPRWHDRSPTEPSPVSFVPFDIRSEHPLAPTEPACSSNSREETTATPA
jgi:hypothetical protein